MPILLIVTVADWVGLVALKIAVLSVVVPREVEKVIAVLETARAVFLKLAEVVHPRPQLVLEGGLVQAQVDVPLDNP